MSHAFFENYIQSHPNTLIEWVSFLCVPSFILGVGVFDDLRSKKVHNKLILILLPIALLSQFIGFGLSGISYGAFGFLLALSLTIPMVLAGMLGGGDMKLFSVFALATNMNAAIWVGMTSLFWGALLGIFRAIFLGQGLVLLTNTMGLLRKEKPKEAHLTKIPYTVALLFGWLTYLTFQFIGGAPS